MGDAIQDPIVISDGKRTKICKPDFSTLYLSLIPKKLTTPAYHPQTSGRIENCNLTLFPRLQHYGAEPQRDWELLYVQPVTYAYNTQM